IANPKLILADEPTGNLHSSQGKEIMELFKKLNEEGTTIIQVTHSEANAEYAHRLIQLADGWVVKGGTESGQEGEGGESYGVPYHALWLCRCFKRGRTSSSTSNSSLK